jgi:hypothetical protein
VPDAGGPEKAATRILDWDDSPHPDSAELKEYNEPTISWDAAQAQLGTQSATSTTSPRAHGGAMNGIVVAPLTIVRRAPRLKVPVESVADDNAVRQCGGRTMC